MIRNYLKIAMKVLLRRKFFTSISLFAVSFTLTVLTVCTALLDHTFGARKPESLADRMLCVVWMMQKGPKAAVHSGAGYGFLDRYVRGIPGAERVSISSRPTTRHSYVGGRKIESSLRWTDGEYWKILQYDFLEGGPFTPHDEANVNHVAVINEATRERFFGGAPALGRTIEVDNQSFRVVGVVRNVPILRLMSFSDIWVPISTRRGQEFRKELVGDFIGLILASDRSLIPAIRSEFQSRLAQVEFPNPKVFNSLHGAAETYFEEASRAVSNAESGSTRAAILWAVFVGGAVLFMSLPAINLVNINLSRILERASEIGVRRAFGATSATLVGQFVVENVFLTLVGGVLGWLASAIVLAALNRSGLIPYAQLDLNWRILVWGLLTAVFFGLLSGVYPAWRMSRLHPVEALRRRPE